MHVDKEENEEPLKVLVKKGQQENYLKTKQKKVLAQIWKIKAADLSILSEKDYLISFWEQIHWVSTVNTKFTLLIIKLFKKHLLNNQTLFQIYFSESTTFPSKVTRSLQ